MKKPAQVAGFLFCKFPYLKQESMSSAICFMFFKAWPPPVPGFIAAFM